jgi:two-component sensor histidine kinase
MEGPAVRVTAKAAQALTMVFHELATNAAKYGAWASSGGRVRISWQINAEGLTFDWRERGGTRVAGVPSRVGFGSRLIDTNIQDQLGGTLERRWTAGGLELEAHIPLEHLQLNAEAPDGRG